MNKLEYEEMESLQRIRRETEDQIIKIRKNIEYKTNSILPEVIGFVGIVISYILLF